MTVYAVLLALSAGLTAGTFLHHGLFRQWLDLLWAIPIGVAWFLAATALYFLALYLISLTVDKAKPVRKREPVFRWILNETVWLILRLGRVRIHCTGLDKLEGFPRFLLVANHRSDFDPFVAIAACPKAELAYVAKPEIFNIPITGRMVHRCCFLPIDRENNRAALETIYIAADLLQKGTVSIGIYPEGTRSKTGELLPFRNGAFKIAKRAGAPIVIAKTTGTERIAHRFARKTTQVRFDVLAVLDSTAVAQMSTREIGDYARALMLQDQNDTQKEGTTK